MKVSTYSYQLKLAASQHQKEKKYWEDKLGANPVKSIFNYDKKKIDGTVPQYEICEFNIKGDFLLKLKNLSKENDYTFFIILNAALSYILYRYTGNLNPDIIIGTTIFKKNTESDLINSILALRTLIDDSNGFKDLLIQSKQTVIEAIENQNFPFPVLVDQLKNNIPEDECPLFDVVLILENIQTKEFLVDIPYRVLFSFTRKEDSIGCIVEYDSRLYYQETILQIIDHFLYFLESSLNDINRKLTEISIITPLEKEKLLYGFNQIRTDYPQDVTAHKLFEDQVMKTPDNIAVIGPFGNNPNPNTKDTLFNRITYRTLNEKADQLAYVLRKNGVAPDTIIGINIDPSIEMIIGLVGILKTGSAYLPISPEWPADRVEFIIKDSGASVIIDKKFISEAIISGHEKPGEELSIRAQSLCYIIYTSGSTGKPKGVMIEHRNLIANIFAFFHQFSITSHDTVIHLSDYTFDAFAEELYPVLLKGGKMVIPGPDAYLDISLLGELINRYHVGIIDCSPLLLNELNKLPFLKPVRIIISGGDVLREKYIDHLSKIGNIFNTYGPTETTICAAYYPYIPSAQEILRPSIPIGKPIANYKILILDDSLSLVPTGVVGEICISGPGVARGYLNRPELTVERFIFFPHELNEITQTSPTNTIANTIYKTGDIGRWLADGNIEYIGRKDFQVKIRGFRIETGEIETLLLNTGLVQDVIVDARIGKDGEKFLCAYYIEEENISESLQNDPQALKHRLQEKLPAYMIPSVFMKLEKFPILSSGKINRKALPEPVIKVSNEFIEPRNEIERQIVIIWKEILELERIGINDNFFELGGHSLLGIQVINRIQQEFNVKIPFTDIFVRSTINQLALLIAEQENQIRQIVDIAEEKDYYNVSSAQKRLFILHQLAPDTTVYNMPYIFPISNYSKEKIEEIFKLLIVRHDSLRTFFQMVDNEPVQRILKDVNFTIGLFQLETSLMKDHLTGFVKPFDLNRAPLLRVEMVEIGTGISMRRFLLLDMHHIITDGVSQAILHREFLSLLKGEKLPSVSVQYKDYSEWQRTEVTRERLNKQKQYWLSQFTGEIPVLNLPTDYPRPVVQSFEGKAAWFELDKEQFLKFRQLALGTNTTTYILSLAIFYTLLTKLSGQEDILIGTPVAGRSFPEFENIIGMFVNTLVLRNNVSQDIPFNRFLEDLKNRTLEAFQNQDYPFEELVESIALKRDTARNPLFDVMFALQNEKELGVDANSVDSPDIQFNEDVSRFDITWLAVESPDGLRFMLEYCSRLFNEETIERFIHYYKQIISVVLENPSILLSQVEIITSPEKEQILYDFNRDYNYERSKTIHDLFAQQVERTPDNPALVTEDARLTYKELESLSNQVSYGLILKGIQPGDFVAIKMNRSIEMIATILGILKARCAYVPMNPKNPEERTRFMMADSGAKLLITSLTELIEDMENKKTLDISPLGRLNYQQFPGAAIQNHSLAYVIYTSGSTGNPKGVPISHANLCPLLHWGFRNMGLNSNDRTLQNLSYFFDWSVFEISITLTSGASLYITNEETVLIPEEMITYLKKHQITVLHITPTQYQGLINTVVPGMENELLLGTLKHLCIGAEKLTYETVKRSYSLVREDCHIYNMYGPTEATIMAAVLEIDRSKGYVYENLGSVPIGFPISNNLLFIFDKYMRLCPVKVVGELYIGGEGIARGYLNNPELTADRFNSFQGLILKNPPLDPDKTSDINEIINEQLQSPLSKSFKGVQGGVVHKAPLHKNQNNKTIYYKTGDLCRWIEDGTIEYIGRIDFQVKIRGLRIELGEIENNLLTHSNIKSAVVIVKGSERLCAYVVLNNGTSVRNPNWKEEIKEYLAQRLPQYMVPSNIIEIEHIPLNPNGKIDMEALPDPGDLEQGKQYFAPETFIEKQLVSIWASVLGIQENRIGIDDDFFELGGHSLKGTILLSQVYSQLNIKLTLSQLFISPTIRELARVIEKMDREDYLSIPKAQEQEYYVMSPAQLRLYILGKIDPNSTQYNLPALFELGEEVDIERIEKIFNILIQRHESLRTSFLILNDKTFQQIQDSVPFSLIHEKVESEEQLESKIKWFIRPFDLTTPPLFRACVFHLKDIRRYLIIDMHHIISDGTSMEIFKKEFLALYRDNLSTHSLIPLKISYKDYSQWLEGVQEKERALRQKEFWLKQFNGELPVLNLPLDYIRPVIQSFEGTTIPFKLEIPQTRQLNRIAIENNATLFMVCLGLFHILLSRLSRQDDIIIGTPVAGRRHPELANIIGMFINTLALRNVSDESLTFIEFLNQIKTSTLNAFENQEYPFEDILEAVKVQRDTARNPLFDVMFALQNMEAAVSDSDSSLEIKPVSFESNIAKFDITLIAYENNEELNLVFEYCTRLFKEESIKRFICYFKNIVACVTQNPRIPISRIDIITPQEREQILFQFNRQEGASNASYKTLTCLFQEQVERTPDHIALSELPVRLTFRELDEEARRFSLYLIKKGIRPRDLVAISIHRSIQMIIGVLGILKAGCTYVPINPKNPENRIKYLMEDSGARLLIDTGSFEEANQLMVEEPLVANELPSSSVDDFAYVLYTSGSTGNPKGVPITHANLFPLLYWGQTNLRFDYTDRTIQTPSFFFDWSVWEIFLTLSSGASLYIINDDILLNPANMIQFIYKHHITILHVTPTQCRYLVDLKHPLTPLRYLFMGGEKLTLTLVRELFELLNSRCRVFNQYGATEATIISTSIELDRNNYLKYNTMSGISIGWTVTGTTLYIFDRSMNLCPVNVPGELYIGGEGIARGYLNNPELTAERFIFSSRELHELTRTSTTNTLYKTGDLVKWLEDGQIEFLGRIDFQVKIRGYRIETGEIENFLMGYKNIKDAVVVALDDEANREKFLCAYFVSYEGEVSIKELREHLGKNMPQYMIPQAFVQLEYIPWNPNGKADLKQLPRPQLKAKEGFISPANEIEEKMIEIWASVLGLEKEAISMDDNFFLIGGHSLKATILLTKVHQVFDIEIALAEIFKSPTPHELCTLISLTKWEFKPGESEDTEFEEILL